MTRRRRAEMQGTEEREVDTTVSRSINAATVPELLEGANERSLARVDPSKAISQGSPLPLPSLSSPLSTTPSRISIDNHLESRSSSLTSKRSLPNRPSPLLLCVCFLSSFYLVLVKFSLSFSSILGPWKKEKEKKKKRRKREEEGIRIGERAG